MIPSSIPCNLCGNREAFVLSNRSRSGKPLRTVICSRCGLIWSDPFPYESRKFYSDDYRLFYKKTFYPKPKHILRAGELAIERYNKIKQFLSKNASILDVGSGAGEFLYLMKVLGYRVKGVEPNKGYAEYSIKEYNLDVEIGFFQDLTCKSESFDLVTIWHVLEHVENPCEVLQKANYILVTEGVLVIEVPNVEAVCQAPNHRFHEAHLFNFNLATLRALVNRFGFVELQSFLSSDGGNLTLIARKMNSDTKPVEVPTGNCERLVKKIRSHTLISHYMSPYPYERLFNRLRRAFFEQIKVLRFGSGKQILDRLYLPLRELD